MTHRNLFATEHTEALGDSPRWARVTTPEIPGDDGEAGGMSHIGKW